MPEPDAQFFTTHVQEDEDGDLILTFPDGFLDAVGWREGDELEFSAFGNRMQITKVAGRAETDGGLP
jgi:hypothetical protein